MKARAVIFDQAHHVRTGDIEIPEPTEQDILVETEVSGVSVGTERWAYIGKRDEVAFPSVPGYMGVGVIRQSGEQAARSGWNTGERVYFFASRLAGEMEGRSWMGSHLSHAVINVCGPRGNGLLQIHHCEKVPSGLEPEDAALCGLAGVALRGIEMAVVPVGASVLVCGLGVIGQFAAQICQIKGASVVGTDVVSSRLDVAKKLGIDHVIHGRETNLAEASRAIQPNGFDVIIDTSGSAQVVNSLFPLLKLGGKFVFQGWYPPPSPLDLNALHQRLPSVFFPCAHSAEAVEAALRWAAKGFLKTKPLVTHTFKPDDAAQMYEMIAAGSDHFLGIVIDWRKLA